MPQPRSTQRLSVTALSQMTRSLRGNVGTSVAPLPSRSNHVIAALKLTLANAVTSPDTAVHARQPTSEPHSHHANTTTSTRIPLASRSLDSRQLAYNCCCLCRTLSWCLDISAINSGSALGMGKSVITVPVAIRLCVSVRVYACRNCAIVSSFDLSRAPSSSC